MPRTVRISSATKVYHIIARGNNKQKIFLERKDYEKYLDILKKYKEKFMFEIYCYILMPNHIHMIINEQQSNISKIMHSILQEYSMHYNGKYEKCGHVFQDRFKSRAVENQEYLLNLQRYIHLNCVKAGISFIDKYEWSSYIEYTNNSKMCNTDVILKLFGNNKNESVKNFIIFNGKRNFSAQEENIAEFEMESYLTEEEAKEQIKKVIDEFKFDKIQEFDSQSKRAIIAECAKINGLSIRQIARTLNVNRITVEKIKKSN